MTFDSHPLRHGAALALSTLALLAGAALPARASHVGEDAAVDQQTVSATDQLLSALRQFENAPESVRAARTQQLVQLAQARQERLLRLLERNPRLAAMRLLPPGLRERFPAAARAWVEEDVRASGSVLASVADDFARGVSHQQFLFQSSPSAAALALSLADGADAERALLALAGKRVSVEGTRLGGHLLVRSRSQLVALDGSTSTGTVVTTTPKVQGAQKTLVILASFTDKPLSCSAADVQGRVFGGTGSTVNTAFLESSRNLVSFNGNVVGPFPINYSSTGSCDYSAWASAAEAAARAAGVDPSQYARVNYVTPANSSCGWTGLAYMPGRQSWVQACSSTGVYTHELGHNLSLHHATTPGSEYGDASDPMGGARNVRHNGANQAMAGWVPTGSLIDVSSSGSYSVGLLGGESGSSAQVLRLRKADTAEYYYLSLREAVGLDAGLPSTALNTISVHRATGSLPAKTVLLANLGVGQTYSDTVNGIQVLNQGVSGSSATVAVSFGGGSCARSAPAVSVSPASQSGSPGVSRSYAVSVTNTNSAGCGSGSFSLSQALPPGFSGGWSTGSLSIAAGASANATFTATPSSSAVDGSYTLDLTATDTAGSASTVHAAYVLMTVANTPPVIASITPASGSTVSGKMSTIGAAVSDDTGVASVEFYVDGKLLARDTSAPYSANWNLRKAGKGTATIKVRATDTAGAVSEATSTVTVN